MYSVGDFLKYTSFTVDFIIKKINVCLYCINYVLLKLFPGIQCSALHNSIFKSMDKLAGDEWDGFHAKVVLSGGNSMLAGLPERLEREIGKLIPSGASVQLVAENAARQFHAWMGASIVSNMSTFIENNTVTKAEYEEYGSDVVHKKTL